MRQNINTDSTGEKFQQLFTWLLPAVYFLGGGLLVAFVLNFYQHEVSHDPGDWGVLGDYFGGLMNPVISFATLLVAYAVWKLQRVELDETKKALKDQAKTAEQQRREQRFFDLLNVYYRTTESLRFDPDPTRAPFHGKEAIQKWLSFDGLWAFTQRRGVYVKVIQPFAPENPLAHLKHAWDDGGALFFGTYLRTMTSILSRATTLFKEEHETYVELLKAQLSNSELVLIGYHLLFDQRDSEELMEHAKRYGLLSHLMIGDLRSALEDNLPPESSGPHPTDVHKTARNLFPC